jgi:hypothetical protein
MVCITWRVRAVKASWIVLLLGLSGPVLAQPLDATVETTRGGAVKLSSLWGKPVVVFYEDKDGTGQNQSLKDELEAQGRARGLTRSVRVVAVASVEGYDWFPAKNFVVSAVKDAESQSGIPVYLDWQGALKRKPWGLTGRGSTVLVLDGAGTLFFSRNGALTREEISQVVTLLVRLVTR